MSWAHCLRQRRALLITTAANKQTIIKYHSLGQQRRWRCPHQPLRCFPVVAVVSLSAIQHRCSSPYRVWHNCTSSSYRKAANTQLEPGLSHLSPRSYKIPPLSPPRSSSLRLLTLFPTLIFSRRYASHQFIMRWHSSSCQTNSKQFQAGRHCDHSVLCPAVDQVTGYNVPCSVPDKMVRLPTCTNTAIGPAWLSADCSWLLKWSLGQTACKLVFCGIALMTMT